jgi:hypothetical protein
LEEAAQSLGEGESPEQRNKALEEEEVNDGPKNRNTGGKKIELNGNPEARRGRNG